MTVRDATSSTAATSSTPRPRVALVDPYTFRQTGRKVRNERESRLAFRDGLIVSHEDVGDPVAWGAMALAGRSGVPT
jgi:hypothetical protein